MKQLSGDINEEVDTHNRMLDRMVFTRIFVILIFYHLLTDAIVTEHFARFLCRAMIWIHQGDFSQEPWTALKRYI